MGLNKKTIKLLHKEIESLNDVLKGNKVLYSSNYWTGGTYIAISYDEALEKMMKEHSESAEIIRDLRSKMGSLELEIKYLNSKLEIEKRKTWIDKLWK